MRIFVQENLKVAFVSNYINHHQIPFCNAMHRLLRGGFTFVQTEAMEEERVRMGWHETVRPAYVRCFYEEEELCRRLIMDCDVVLFGGTDEEGYIVPRLEAGRPVIRISERLYKTGQWKAVSPRGLRKKYKDHTRYRKGAVYLLCAGAYVASDFHIVRAYPKKMFCWGYFPETKHYDVDRLLEQKGYGADRVPYLLWAARMIDWKHPELALETAKYLKERGLAFHLDIIGDGDMHAGMEDLAERYGLEDCVAFLGFRPPEAVREYMERADIFLFTSDRQEGWGAVANEAMNSGCALVADHMIGAVPYLVRSGENGFIYQNGKRRQLFSLAEGLVRDRALCRRLGRGAYETITGVWNAENAAGRLLELMEGILGQGGIAGGIAGGAWGSVADSARSGIAGGAWGGVADNARDGMPGVAAPCAPAPMLSERRARREAGKALNTQILRSRKQMSDGI